MVNDADCKFEPTVMAVEALVESYTGLVNFVTTPTVVPLNEIVVWPSVPIIMGATPITPVPIFIPPVLRLFAVPMFKIPVV